MAKVIGPEGITQISPRVESVRQPRQSVAEAGTVGRGIQGVAEVGAQISDVIERRDIEAERLLAETQAKVQAKRDAITRIDLVRDNDTAMREAIGAAGDLSVEANLTGLGALFSKIERDTIQEGRGQGLSEDELLELAASTGGSNSRFTAEAAKAGVAQGRQKLIETNGVVVSRLNNDVVFNPDLLDDAIAQHDQSLVGLRLDSAEAFPLRQAAIGQFGTSAATTFILRGDPEKARSILRREDVKSALGPAGVSRLFDKIKAIENKRLEAQTAATTALTTVRTLLGPDATEEQIRTGAQQLLGLDTGRNLQFIPSGDRILVMDKDDATLVKTIDLPKKPGEFMTDEEKAAENLDPRAVWWKSDDGSPPKKLADPVLTNEEIAALAQSKESGKLAATATFLSQIYSEAGYTPEESAELAVDTASTPAARSPFGRDVVSSDDAQFVARDLVIARRLLAIGKTGLASGFLANADFRMKNSPEMRRERELDKPLSEDLLRETGLPVGATYRDVQGTILRSPEEVAEFRAISAGRGAGRVKGEEQLAFIGAASEVIENLLDEIEADPGIVGARGTLRAAGQTVVGVLSDLGAEGLINAAREIAFQELSLDETEDMFSSPTLSTLDIMENTIGLILARIRTPTGRIPVDVIKRSIKDTQLSGAKSSEQIVNRLNFILNRMKTSGKSVRERFDLDPGIPRFKIGPDGGLVQVN